MSNNSIWGTSIGAGAGLVKGVQEVLLNLSASSIKDTIILAAIGAIVGFAITELLNYIKKKIKK